MLLTRLGILSALGLLACSSDAPPGASTAKDVTLPDSALTRLSEVSLLRAGAGFTLVGYDNGQIRWGRLTLDGVLTEQAGFPLGVTPVGPAPVFAATKRTTPGDQVVAIALTNSTLDGAYDLVAVVQTAGETTASVPVVLATLPRGTDPATVQIAAGAATSGNVGFVAWGTRVAGVSVNYLVLPTNAMPTTPAGDMYAGFAPSSVPAWGCLRATPGSTGIGFSVVTTNSANPSRPHYETAEIDEAGNGGFPSYELTVPVSNCHIVGSPGVDGGYVMAFDSDAGIAVAMNTLSKGNDGGSVDLGSVETVNPLMANATFGGVLNRPIPAWVSSPGGDYSIGLQRRGAPQVVRYTFSGSPHGSALTLRSDHGQTGAISAWVGTDAVYVTYTDDVSGPGNSTTTKRYFMRIDSPAVLP